MLHFTFLLKPCHANAAKKRCASTTFFYAISFQSVNSKACGSKAWQSHVLCFIFWLMKLQSRLIKCNSGFVMLSQPPQSAFNFEVY
jgi:hypothetical protein